MNDLAALDGEREGLRWPHRERSRFVQAAGLRWHVQHWPAPSATAPTALLLHGTGASTHSWRQVAPLLAGHMQVVSVDLPGHAFTQLPAEGSNSPQLSLPGMAQGVQALLKAMEVQAQLIVGHSAGAAVAVRMALDGMAGPRLIVSINGALLPLHGLAGQLFAPAARLMAGMSWIPRLFAYQARDRAVTERLLQSTGSRIDEEGTALYALLVASPSHAAAARNSNSPSASTARRRPWPPTAAGEAAFTHSACNRSTPCNPEMDVNGLPAVEPRSEVRDGDLNRPRLCRTPLSSLADRRWSGDEPRRGALRARWSSALERRTAAPSG